LAENCFSRYFTARLSPPAPGTGRSRGPGRAGFQPNRFRTSHTKGGGTNLKGNSGPGEPVQKNQTQWGGAGGQNCTRTDSGPLKKKPTVSKKRKPLRIPSPAQSPDFNGKHQGAGKERFGPRAVFSGGILRASAIWPCFCPTVGPEPGGGGGRIPTPLARMAVAEFYGYSGAAQKTKKQFPSVKLW